MTKLRKYKSAIALLAILALALWLRGWGISWGLPYVFHSDEPKYLPLAVDMLVKGDLNPHYFENPPLLTYLFLLETISFELIGRALGSLHSAADVAAGLFWSPTDLFLMVRMSSVILGTATVLLTYQAAKQLLGVETGLLSALLLAVAFLHVRDSHYAVNDVPATFLLMVSFYFVARIYVSRSLPGEVRGENPAGRRRNYLLAGVFLGLGAATKYNVSIGAVSLLVAHLLSQKKPLKTHGIAAHLPLLGAGLLSFLAFVLANPYSVLDSTTFLAQFASQYGWTSDPYSTSDLPIGLIVLRALYAGTSPIVLGASFLGLALLSYQHPRDALLLASFPLAYAVFFLFGSSLFYARFAIPLLPFVAILAGYGTMRAIHHAGPGVPRAAAAILVTALLALPPAALDVRHDSLLQVEDTRLLLGRWIHANVPPGSNIAVEGYSFIDSMGKPLGIRGVQYELTILPSLRQQPLEYYRREGFDYLVVSSYVYGRYELASGRHDEAIEWYQRADREFILEASFSPTADGRELPFVMDEELTPIYTVLERNRPGPTLKVYRLGQPPEYEVGWLEAAPTAHAEAGQEVVIPVTLRNEGNVPWPNDGLTPVRIGARWIDSAGHEVEVPDLRSPLPKPVEPGEEVMVPAGLMAPTAPGSYTLQLDLVQENIAWFSAKGARIKEVKVEVGSPTGGSRR